MKVATSLLIFGCLSASLPAKPIPMETSCENATRVLEKAIPSWAVDKLFEAKRTGGGWSLKFQTDFGKNWLDEVRITVLPNAASSCFVEVAAVHLENNLFGSLTTPSESRSNEWTAKIVQSLNGPPPASPSGASSEVRRDDAPPATAAPKTSR